MEEAKYDVYMYGKNNKNKEVIVVKVKITHRKKEGLKETSVHDVKAERKEACCINVWQTKERNEG